MTLPGFATLTLHALALGGALFDVTSASPALVHDDVEGAPISTLTVSSRQGAPAAKQISTPAELAGPRAPGPYSLRFVASGEFVRIPHCAGRKGVFVDGTPVTTKAHGPVVVPLVGAGPHDVRVDVDVSKYEKRIACGEPVRAGKRRTTTEGLTVLTFASPHTGKGGGEAVLFVPSGHDVHARAPLLVSVHPWNGSPWTYAAYRELLEEAQARDVVVLMPSGLGNSLYTAPAEDEVMLAIDATSRVIAIDPQRVSIWGASMGGAGATTIAFHHPDRFASVTSFFGDSRYDLSTYVRSILKDEAGAHAVNALDVVDNARHLPVWLVHGAADKTSKIEQSELLFRAMRSRAMSVRFDSVPGMGHEAPLVVNFLREVVTRAATLHAPTHPARVTYRSVRKTDLGAYGVTLDKAGRGDAFIDIERKSSEILVLRAENVSAVTLAKGALGARGDETVRFAPGVREIVVRWEDRAQPLLRSPEPKKREKTPAP